ncbi:WXG100 family type VII secretion target [Nocardia sp. NPDC051570]|uniref:WXG100 family type VII secretion target n=1 Tax=Nocardia sp. NPDC051570 TaxID=3364324 RepID=UPI0037A8E07F
MADRAEMDPAEVHDTAGWLETSAREFTDELDKLMREVHAFIGGDWQGGAAGTHHEAWTEWEQGARQVIAGLEHDAAALHHIANAAVSTDRGNADGIGGAGLGVG